jgi:hypothetical protein
MKRAILILAAMFLSVTACFASGAKEKMDALGFKEVNSTGWMQLNTTDPMTDEKIVWLAVPSSSDDGPWLAIRLKGDGNDAMVGVCDGYVSVDTGFKMTIRIDKETPQVIEVKRFEDNFILSEFPAAEYEKLLGSQRIAISLRGELFDTGSTPKAYVYATSGLIRKYIGN